MPSRAPWWVAAALAAVSASVALAASPKKTAMFNLTAIHAGPGLNVTISSKVWVTPTQARAEVNHPIEGQMIFLVSNGVFYQLEPKSHRGIRAPLPPEMRKNPDNFDRLLTRFAFDAAGAIKLAKKVRTETVTGLVCDVYSNTITKGDVTRSITVWVPQKLDPQIPLKAVMQDRMARPGATVDNNLSIALSNVQVNVPISPGVFSVPSGYTIVDGNPQKPPTGR